MSRENIILIGFMGSGKTVVGRALSRQLSYEFYDTDEKIEEVTGLTIAQIFKKYGERRFRSEEELVIKKLAQKDGQVIATGGSLVLDQHNLDILREGGFFVLLKAEPEIIYQRLCRKNNRPQLGKKPTLEKVKEMIAEREAEYEKLADFSLNTSSFTVEEAASRIANSFRRHHVLSGDVNNIIV